MPTPPQLIRELIARFIDYQNHLAFSGEPYCVLQVHADDQRKVVGKAGTHIQALQHLLGEMGRANGRGYSLRLVEPEPAPIREQCRPVVTATYDVRRAQALIQAFVIALGCPQTIVACDSRPFEGPVGALAYTFVFHVANEREYDRLTVPHPTDAKNRTLVASLGTLFRAIARKDGVDFDILVPRV